MSYSLLDIIPNEDGNFYFSGAVNGIGEALIYALIGFVVVFLGIVLIIFIIWLIGLILRRTNNLAFLSKLSIKNLIKNKKQTYGQPDTAETVSDEISDEIKAAIVAALMAYYEQEMPESEFIVRRIKKIEVC